MTARCQRCDIHHRHEIPDFLGYESYIVLRMQDNTRRGGSYELVGRELAVPAFDEVN